MSPSYNNQLTIWILKKLPDSGLSIQVTSALTGDPAMVIEKLSSSTRSGNEPTEVLLDYRTSFEYLAKTPSGEKYWTKKWNAEEEKVLPLAVRINLRLIDDSSEDEKIDRILALILANEHQTIKPKK